MIEVWCTLNPIAGYLRINLSPWPHLYVSKWRRNKSKCTQKFLKLASPVSCTGVKGKGLINWLNWLNHFPFRHFRPLLIEKTLLKFKWILHSHQWSYTCHVGLKWKIIGKIFKKIKFEDNSSFFGHVVYFPKSRDCWRKGEKIRNPWAKSHAETYWWANRVRFWWKHNASSLLKPYKLS